MSEKKSFWWHSSTVYQVYVRSFQDSNGDGIGDLPGLISRLDYLRDLGIDVVWLTPVYDSPQYDNGYDIRDYRTIAPEYGTMADMEALIEELHTRGMRLILDMVVNHTSWEHPWFRASCSADPGKYRDYYIWREAPPGTLPNNWMSYFQGPVWEWAEERRAYYLHLFAKEQPDLNWENPAVREEVYRILCFWADKGIDGFRMDVINLLSKHPDLPSVPGEGLVFDGRHFMNGPNIHDYLQEMYREVFEGRDLLIVGETPGVTPRDALLYTRPERKELDMLFHFEHMDLDMEDGEYWSRKAWSLKELKEVTLKWQSGLQGRGWNSNYLNNHDQPRMVSRFGNDAGYRYESATLLAAFLHTLGGTPYVYQGEEIGMKNPAFPSIDAYRDIASWNFYREAREMGRPEGEIMEILAYRSRDNARTPMPWDSSSQGGFTTGTPWMMVSPDYKEINAAAEASAERSVLQFYKDLIAFRRKHPVFTYGDFEMLLPDDPSVFAYRREFQGTAAVAVLNFSDEKQDPSLPCLPAGTPAPGRFLGNYPGGRGGILRPWEARITVFYS